MPISHKIRQYRALLGFAHPGEVPRSAEQGRGEEREGKKLQCVLASHSPRTGDLAHNPGMCPDWESNW